MVNTFLTPDFAVMLADGELQMKDIKGFLAEDANVKLKVAADPYPFRFFIVRKGKGAMSWIETQVGNKEEHAA